MADNPFKGNPLRDRVILRVIPEPEFTKSGLIIIPEMAREKAHKAEVLAVGPGRRGEEDIRIPPDVRPGDRVIYGKHEGVEVTIDKVDYLIVRERDIRAIYIDPDWEEEWTEEEKRLISEASGRSTD